MYSYDHSSLFIFLSLKDTLVAKYNDLASVEALLKNKDVAAVILEVIPISPRRLCSQFHSTFTFFLF